MKIKELARMAGMEENVLRFYEKKGLLSPKRDDNSYRNYDIQDYHILMIIRLYRKMDFSIAQIKEMLYGEESKNPMELFFHQQASLNQQIKELSVIREGINQCLDEMLVDEHQQEVITTLLQNTADQLQTLHSWEDEWDFDTWAEHYDEDVHKPVGDGLKFYEHYEEVLDTCAQVVCEENGHVLEIGIGTGNLAQRIAKKQPITGIDQSIKMLMITKRKYPNIPVRTGTYGNIPFKENSFSTVVSSYAFHHNNDQEKVRTVQEMDRVLCNNGRIIICDFMFQDAQDEKVFKETCSPQEKIEVDDEYFAHIDKLKDIFHELHYRCEVLVLEHHLHILTAYKTENL